MTVHALVPCALSVLSYSGCKIIKISPGVTRTPLGRAYSAPPQTPQLKNDFSPCYARQKTSTPKK